MLQNLSYVSTHQEVLVSTRHYIHILLKISTELNAIVSERIVYNIPNTELHKFGYANQRATLRFLVTSYFCGLGSGNNL